jgi:peptide deformylase
MKLQITYEGDPILRNNSEPVEKITPKIRKLIDDMFETMYADNGIGLAAPQVGINQRVIVIDTQNRKLKPIAMVNPELIEQSGEQESVEGCLSCPGLSATVKRAATVTVTGLDPNGRNLTLEADGLLAIVFQHEIDHLNGVLFIDHLDPSERVKVEKQRVNQM